MRIACTNHHRQIVGGTESYLNRVIPELVRLGHEVSLWHEGTVAPGAPQIEAPEIFTVGAESPLQLRAWKPDIIYNNGLMGMDWEESLTAAAPVVHFAHNYYGTCISGEKTRSFPEIRPCPRCFGSACLVQYLPRRCGGANPLTMWHDYQLQATRLRHLRRCYAVITASRHIEEEYRKHGFASVFRAPLFVNPPVPPIPRDGPPHRVLFCGRMMRLKGGDVLIRSIPMVERLVGRSIELTMAGDGPERRNWESLGGNARFTGRIPQQTLNEVAADHDVLAMPSLWPEPFGLAGLELGLPVAAFSVGGIPDWLADGVNGHLAALGDLTSGGIATALARCLSDREHCQSLQAGAISAAHRFSIEDHLKILVPILESAH
jgi:glycosyltransferase involved in cell wall biosynthesis